MSQCNETEEAGFQHSQGKDSVRDLPSWYCPDSVKSPTGCLSRPLSLGGNNRTFTGHCPYSLLHIKRILAFIRLVVIPLLRRCDPPLIPTWPHRKQQWETVMLRLKAEGLNEPCVIVPEMEINSLKWHYCLKRYYKSALEFVAYFVALYRKVIH